MSAWHACSQPPTAVSSRVRGQVHQSTTSRGTSAPLAGRRVGYSPVCMHLCGGNEFVYPSGRSTSRSRMQNWYHLQWPRCFGAALASAGACVVVRPPRASAAPGVTGFPISWAASRKLLFFCVGVSLVVGPPPLSTKGAGRLRPARTRVTACPRASTAPVPPRGLAQWEEAHGCSGYAHA